MILTRMWRTDRRTDGRTHPLIKMRERNVKRWQVLTGYSVCVGGKSIPPTGGECRLTWYCQAWENRIPFPTNERPRHTVKKYQYVDFCLTPFTYNAITHQSTMGQDSLIMRPLHSNQELEIERVKRAIQSKRMNEQCKQTEERVA